MAVYREKRRSRLLPVLVVTAAVVVIGLFWVAAGANRPGVQTAHDRVVAGLRDVSNELDLLLIEYPKLLAGQSSGALPALGRARADFERIRPDLASFDPAAAANFDGELALIENKTSVRAGLADLTAGVGKLRGDIASWLAAHP